MTQVLRPGGLLVAITARPHGLSAVFGGIWNHRSLGGGRRSGLDVDHQADVAATASFAVFPGGAAMGCLNDAANDFQMITATGSFAQGLQPILITPSAAGGLWSLQLHGRGGFGAMERYP